MTTELNARELTGQEETHLVALPCGHRLLPEVAVAFSALQVAAREAGFELAVASSFRSYARQLSLWNAKVSGARQVHDDQGRDVPMASLSPADQLHAIMRYSALPGASRHHWGTDLDVYDTAAVPQGYQVQLTPQEVAPDGMFDALHCWLDARIAEGESHGFFRPYSFDRGGVAPERWHLSYAPLALDCATRLKRELLQGCWDCAEANTALLLRDVVEGQLPELFERYVAVPDDGWVVR